MQISRKTSWPSQLWKPASLATLGSQKPQMPSHMMLYRGF